MHVLSAKERPRILFVYSGLSSFVLGDMEILERHFNVKKLKITTFLVPERGRSPLVFFRLLKGILWCDVAFSWWATLDGFFVVLFCKLLRKNSMIVIGGYEVASVPEINYGLLLSAYGRFEVKFILENASRILAVSKSSIKEMLRFTKPKKLSLVYNCVDTEKFSPSGKKEKLVITVGAVSESTINKKRLDTFVEASRYLPEATLALLGKYDGSIEHLKQIAGRNVVFTGYVSDEQLLDYYRRAKVYCQLSAQESFGVALAEAMSCQCVPVVTRLYSLPEIVADTGFYAPYNNPKATAEAARKALNSDLGEKARKRIQEYFSLEIREKRLVKEILKMMGNN
jgi:glycosyltransferase involved in cell wall biosynthesis